MECKNCHNKTFYYLKDNYIKCKKCAKKYSLKKIEQNKKIVELFIENYTSLEISKILKLNYKTVKNKIDLLRYEIAIFLEEEYNQNIKEYTEFEEYYYFTKREKLKKEKNLKNSIDILGFTNQEKIYNILIINIYELQNEKKENINSKIHSNNFYKTKLHDFWKYLEKNLEKYKGIKKSNFFYYLKEYEFKFNYSSEEQKKILSNYL